MWLWLLKDPYAWLPTFLFAAAILIVANRQSQKMAALRLELARKAFKERAYDRVAAILDGFVRPTALGRNSRFDVTGEAHFLMLRACIELDEQKAAAFCRRALLNGRFGDYSKKAAKIKITGTDAKSD